jgi:hypothetical protein
VPMLVRVDLHTHTVTTLVAIGGTLLTLGILAIVLFRLWRGRHAQIVRIQVGGRTIELDSNKPADAEAMIEFVAKLKADEQAAYDAANRADGDAEKPE